jgi:hypothetical protein
MHPLVKRLARGAHYTGLFGMMGGALTGNIAVALGGLGLVVLVQALGSTYRGARTPDGAAAEIQPTRACPRCAERIQEAALVCRFCGVEFSLEDVQQAAAVRRDAAEARRQRLAAKTRQLKLHGSAVTRRGVAWVCVGLAALFWLAALVGSASSRFRP